MERASMIFFCACAATIAWIYFGYPLALVCGLFGRPKRFMPAKIEPSMSVIIPARNEESGIEAKLRN